MWCDVCSRFKTRGPFSVSRLSHSMLGKNRCVQPRFFLKFKMIEISAVQTQKADEVEQRETRERLYISLQKQHAQARVSYNIIATFRGTFFSWL